jgi:hypothetical protein
MPMCARRDMAAGTRAQLRRELQKQFSLLIHPA